MRSASDSGSNERTDNERPVVYGKHGSSSDSSSSSSSRGSSTSNSRRNNSSGVRDDVCSLLAQVTG